MSSSSNRLGCLAFVAAACLAATACQRTAENATDAAIERASGGKVDIERDGDKVVFKTEDGQLAVQGGDALPLPDDFPKDVYLPDDYVINSVMDLEGVNVLGLRAPGEVPAVFAAARKSMEAQGWKETMAMQHAADSAMLAYEKEQRAAMLSFSRDDDGVQLSVQLRRDRQ